MRLALRFQAGDVVKVVTWGYPRQSFDLEMAGGGAVVGEQVEQNGA
jgi:hypothetical protein